MTGLALDTSLDAEQREYLQVVKSSAESLLTIINDILDFSKIEAGKLLIDRVPFDLRRGVGETLKTLALRATEKGLELKCEIDPGVPPQLVGDGGRLRQVVVNLVANAIKFTQRGEVAVRVFAAERAADGMRIQFSVSDTGVGIAPDKQKHIFEAFAQEDSSTTRRFGGTGLGLTISARLVEMMGGQIWVESETGRGSTFHFNVLLGEVDVAGDADAARDAAPVAGLRALVVDDHASNRWIVAHMLERWGVEVHLADSGTAALEMLRADAGATFDVVVLDACMPVLDGFETASAIRGLVPTRSPAVVMLTAAGADGDVVRCRTLGIPVCLPKPVVPDALLQALKALPRHGQAPKLPRAAPAAAGGAPPMHILLAEDNPVNQLLAVKLFSKWGHAVVVANNGREAVERVRHSRQSADVFDMIFMDVQMPELDGIAATSIIRELEAGTGRHTPIIAMTANAMEGDREVCLASGMDDYIAKPFRSDELRDLLDVYAAAARAEAGHQA
jgi:hypothetical protein